MVYRKIEPGIWKPEKEGDQIIGILVGKENDIGKFKSKVYHLNSDAGEQLSIFGSAVLDDKMSYIKIGDKIKIIFKGKVQGKDASYNNYEVYKDEETESLE